MYTPASFQMGDTSTMFEFIRNHSFGILFSHLDGHPCATHIPFLLEVTENHAARLLGHMAKANPQWTQLDGAEVLVVFQGPHAYVSPTWYVEDQAVPTWNYVAVHVRGKARVILDERERHEMLTKLVRFYEPQSPLLEHLDESFYTRMENAVVGVSIEVAEVEGAAKLSQNKSVDTVRGIIAGLKRSGNCMAREVATLMEKSQRI
jgi:transcriptional regulator